MKPGDIIKVHDGSYSLCKNSKGELHHEFGVSLRDRKWQVIAVGCVLPADDTSGVEHNDLIACEVNRPEHILLTQEELCEVVSRPEEKAAQFEITLPKGVSTATITVNREQ